MDESQALIALAALAKDTRLKIVRYLVQQGPEGASAGDIGAALGASASRLSFHLAALENAGLIASRRASRHIFYTVEYPQLGELVGFLMRDCCANHPVVRNCCRLDG